MTRVRLRRRGVLAACATGTALLAGCGGLLGGTPDVVVFNRTSAALTATVEVVDEAGERLVSSEPTIEASEAFESDDVLPSSGQVTLSVAVDGGPAGDATFEVADAESIQARIGETDIEFSRV